MTLLLAISLVALASILTNRILAVAVGLWFRLPGPLLLGILLFLDMIQIPFYYHLYQKGFSLLDRFPTMKSAIARDWSKTTVGRWAMPLGGMGVMVVSALPTFGGGIWSASFLAYGLGLRRRAVYSWIMLGSLISYLALYWVLETLILTIRYFTH